MHEHDLAVLAEAFITWDAVPTEAQENADIDNDSDIDLEDFNVISGGWQDSNGVPYGNPPVQ